MKYIPPKPISFHIDYSRKIILSHDMLMSFAICDLYDYVVKNVVKKNKQSLGLIEKNTCCNICK